MTWTTLLVWLGPLAAIILPLAALGQIVERKIAAALQRRIGPEDAGLEPVVRAVVRLSLPFLGRARQERLAAGLCGLPGIRHGLAVARRSGLGQLAADGMKMLGKEDLIPADADALVFRLAPYLALAGALLPFAAIPWAQGVCALPVPVGVLYVAATAGMAVVALVMAGWGSGSKWSMLGGMRAVAQVVSYEIPVGLALAGVVLWCGSMDLHQIVARQYDGQVVGILGWNLFQSPFLAVLGVLLVVGGLAECQRTPFDMAEAESELVSGFNTEYSGLRWGMFAMAEYAEMLLVGAVFATLFLGGYQSPVGEAWILALPAPAETAIHLAILTAKIAAMLVLMVWIRWTLPRLRVDQVMRTCWLYLVPIALVCLVGVAATLVLAGGVAPGPAFGAIAAPGHPDLGWLGRCLAWLLPVAAAATLVVAARRRHGRRHPALDRLTGAAP
jgi:NADH-quinone oxidoreductase subunit H